MNQVTHDSRLVHLTQKGVKFMERVCFRLQIKLSRMDEYIERHAEVWSEMRAALSETGWCNYSLFIDKSDGLLIGYLETPNLEAAKAGMAKTDVNARWQAQMGEFFEELEGVAPDEGFIRLTEIFHLL